MNTSTRTILQVGDKAPMFTIPTTDIGEISLTSLLGNPFVLYFYPKDDTPGCTREACDFQDALPQFATLRIQVIGVSRDGTASHVRFKRKHGLDFPLGTDANGEICDRYGVWVEKKHFNKQYMGIERSTFLIDGEGIIRALWRKVRVAGHDEVKQAASAIINIWASNDPHF